MISGALAPGRATVADHDMCSVVRCPGVKRGQKDIRLLAVRAVSDGKIVEVLRVLVLAG